MKICPFCNVPMEDNAKFCTNCGQKVETPAAPTIYESPAAPRAEQGMSYVQQPTNPQGSFVSQGGGNSYAQPPTNQQGGFVSQGGPNGYGQPSAQQGASGYGQPGMSGPAMQHGSVSQSGTPYMDTPQNGMSSGAIPQGGMPQPGMPQNPKKKSVLPFIIIGVLALIAVITVVVLFATGILGGGNNSADDKNLGEWKAVSLVKDGQILDPKDYLDGEMVITLKKGGKASVSSGGSTVSATWTLKGDKFTIKGGGLDETGTLEDDALMLKNMGGSGADWIFTKDGKPVSGQSGNQTGNDVTDKNPGGWTHDDGPDPNAPLGNASDYDDKDTEAVSFQNFAGEYYFSSGAGGWGTEVTINADGSFTGSFHDSNMGEMGDGYSNGTFYLCNFSGRFSKLTKKDEFTYTCTLEEITQEEKTGLEKIEDEVKYVYSDPYGFDDAKEFEFYLPGKSVADFDQSFLMWMMGLRYNTPYPDTLLNKAFNNLANNYGFEQLPDYTQEVNPIFPQSLPLELYQLPGSYINKKLGIVMGISVYSSYEEGNEACGSISWEIPDTVVGWNADATFLPSDNGFDAKAEYNSEYKIIVTDNTPGKVVIHLYDSLGRDCGEYVMTKHFES